MQASDPDSNDISACKARPRSLLYTVTTKSHIHLEFVAVKHGFAETWRNVAARLINRA